MTLIDCDEGRHSAAILGILNDAILNSTALYEYVPRPPSAMAAWFAAKRAGGFPVLGVEDGQGTLLGFATYGGFRGFAAYKYTVEHSVYVHPGHRGRGVGRQLLSALVGRARAQDLHLLVGALDAANAASIALHEGLGFAHAGTIREAAYKFDRWLDLAFYQLRLDTPQQPVGG
ncbi:MAG: hypothetical protein RLZZ393_88 [Pseudomonadota bacterium]|jgi:phosphinothricin acetyltransferase